MAQLHSSTINIAGEKGSRDETFWVEINFPWSPMVGRSSTSGAVNEPKVRAAIRALVARWDKEGKNP